MEQNCEELTVEWKFLVIRKQLTGSLTVTIYATEKLPENLHVFSLTHLPLQHCEIHSLEHSKIESFAFYLLRYIFFVKRQAVMENEVEIPGYDHKPHSQQSLAQSTNCLFACHITWSNNTRASRSASSEAKHQGEGDGHWFYFSLFGFFLSNIVLMLGLVGKRSENSAQTTSHPPNMYFFVQC